MRSTRQSSHPPAAQTSVGRCIICGDQHTGAVLAAADGTDDLLMCGAAQLRRRRPVALLEFRGRLVCCDCVAELVGFSARAARAIEYEQEVAL
jgi:hypothetical protein